ncbi:hypothetical protein VaNZ11_009598 [Volvox africanus]|uniref:Uncharacterized protein n=1 Tax=Volvox africanus TaxID=51714 RepID=A0ABQ5S918_9CHLO|nr:hypothetical protein VaNZ11_009598 [Volvox africanus]
MQVNVHGLSLSLWPWTSRKQNYHPTLPLYTFCPAHRSKQETLDTRRRRAFSGTHQPLTTNGTPSADACDTMIQITGLSEVSGRYKALLLDQFGVLHDGRRPYPGAVEAVEAAADSGLRLIIISNSSRRSGGTLDKLAAMGFERRCFEGVVTSGELTHRYLTLRPDDWWSGLGSRCLHINWSRRGPASLEDTGLQVVADPRDADFFLAHGTEALSLPGGGVEERPLEELKALLRGAAEEAVRARTAPPPLVVANPDVVTVDGDDLVAMPGSLAAVYSQAGGPVVLMGKPSPLIYMACGEMLGLAPSEMLAVGDSLEHDVAGALAAGVDSLFIAGGIHARELLVEREGSGESVRGQQHSAQKRVDVEALQRLVKNLRPAVSRVGAARDVKVPTYVAPHLVW